MNTEQVFTRNLTVVDGVVTAEYKTESLRTGAEIAAYLQRQLDIDNGVFVPKATSAPLASKHSEMDFDDLKQEFSSVREPRKQKSHKVKTNNRAM